MCTATQVGYNHFWTCMQTGTNLRTCFCGNICHKEAKSQSIWDQEQTLTATIDNQFYVHEDTYNGYSDWNRFNNYPPYPSENH